jgi:hypothetical protein
MGLLDELEQEAERRRNEEAKAEADRETRDTLWREKLRPGMEQLAAYLRKLTEQLTFLKRRTRVTYPLAGYGDVVAYIEPQFEFRDVPGKTQHEITLEFFAQIAPEECPNLVVEGASKVRALQSLFQQQRVGTMAEPRKNAGGEVVAARFQARGKIPLKLAIAAERDSGVAKMQFVNYEGLNPSSRSFTPELLDEKLFDALGRFIARDEATFAQESLGEDLRRQLQSKIQRDQMKREWENKLSRQLADDEAKVLSYMGTVGANPGSMLGRVVLATRKLFGR